MVSIYDEIFQLPRALAKHKSAPLLAEREQYLEYHRRHGRKDIALRSMACHLLQINRTLGLTNLRVIAPQELEETARQWASYVGPYRRRLPQSGSYELYLGMARGWLKFHGCLGISPDKVHPFEERLRQFARILSTELYLTPDTVRTRRFHAGAFLRWVARRNVRLRNMSVSHIEGYMDFISSKGWKSATRAIAANSLKVFFRVGERRGWCRRGLWLGVIPIKHSPYSLTARGPAWRDVSRLLRSLNGSDPVTIRDKAIILLFVAYGLRVGEVAHLLLTDIDFDADTLTVRRLKRGGTQRFSLRRDLKEALRRYITTVRPKCDCPQIFITFQSPHRPLGKSSFRQRTATLFERLSIQTLNKGPHAFRHACAERMMRQGVSVEDITAFLGHTNSAFVRGYVHYELRDLRKLADFRLDGLA